MPAPFSALLGLTLALPPPPPPLPPIPALQLPARPSGRNGGQDLDPRLASGRVVIIGGRPQQARWQWQPASASRGEQLWLPLELLEGQLGIRSSSRSDGSLLLEWFGRRLEVPAQGQRSLDDEVAVEVAELLRSLGFQLDRRGEQLTLASEPLPVAGVRQGSTGSGRRIVLDLPGATWIRRQDNGLVLGLRSQPDQRRDLEALGLVVGEERGQLLLQPGSGQRLDQVLTLGQPFRIALEVAPATPGSGEAPGPGTDSTGPTIERTLEARLQALLAGQVTWQRQVLNAGPRRMLINSIRLDPRNANLTLQPLTGAGGMEGLSSLVALAGRHQALVAINGGFFNRVRRLPLGALRDGGRWLSGPILQRGVMAWTPQRLPRFGRLSLEETLIDGSGGRWPLLTLNSGYVQRGLSRYTADWGPTYRALSGSETAILIRAGQVQARLDSQQLKGGQPLAPGDSLVVARGGVPVPGAPGETVALQSRASNDLGNEPNMIGGGPLLLAGGQNVLDGEAERFSPAFLGQGAPRTVVGSDGRQLWLITLEGVGSSGPTLPETAQLLLQLGLQEALNLDGGSSTGLVLGGIQTVKGRGVAGAVNNGLGLVPITPMLTRTLPE